MAGRIHEIGTICRFCLGKDGLVALMEATKSTISYNDILRYTGVEISCDLENLCSICAKCVKTIQNFNTFRRSCMNNDSVFGKLVSVLRGSGISQNDAVETNGIVCLEIPDESISEGQMECINAVVEDVQQNRTDSMLSDVNPEACENSRQGFREVVDRQDATSLEEADLIVLDSSNDSNYSMPSLYGECMEQMESVAVDESRGSSIPDNESLQQLETNSKQGEEMRASTAGTSIQAKDSHPPDADSDDSIKSLYSEVMGKKKKNISDTAQAQKLQNQMRKLCPYCGLMIIEIKTHIERIHIRDKKYSCPHCPVKKVNRFSIRKHINSVHEKRIILTCEHCGKGFTNSSSHYYHLANSHGKYDSYECETCSRKFKSYDGYKKHLKEHSLTSYPCPSCDKLFKTSVTLEKHQQRYHSS